VVYGRTRMGRPRSRRRGVSPGRRHYRPERMAERCPATSR
jgi:hypothetical protein